MFRQRKNSAKGCQLDSLLRLAKVAILLNKTRFDKVQGYGLSPNPELNQYLVLNSIGDGMNAS